MKRLMFITMTLLITACKREIDSINAYHFYQTCEESKRIDIADIHAYSTCNGINIILASYLDKGTITYKGINYILYAVFKDEKGKMDWNAMEQFQEPGSGQTLGHLIAEFGSYSEIEELFERYSKNNLLYLVDFHGENIFHKMARNTFNGIYLNNFCDEQPKIRSLIYQKNHFGTSPLELAAERGEFNKVFTFHACGQQAEPMAALFVEHGVELAFDRDIGRYPELFDYLTPYLMEQHEVQVQYGSKLERRSLYEVHRYSQEFGKFIAQNDIFYEQFMQNTELMNRMLNSSGAPEYADGYGNTTIYYYAGSSVNDRKLYRNILLKTNVHHINKRGESIFHALAKNAKTKELKQALKKLQDNSFLLKKDLNGKTALDVCKEDACKILKKATPVL